MPDGVVSPRDFVQIMHQLGDSGVHTNLDINQGNTVIFDSFSPDDEVRRLNLKNNNVSKLNNMPSRFSGECNVRVRAASITAILCANTVSDYKIIDRKSKQELTASDKRPEYMRAQQHEAGSSNKRPRSEPQAPDGIALPAAAIQYPQQVPSSFQRPPPPPPCHAQFATTPLRSAFDHPGIPHFMYSPSHRPEISMEICSILSSMGSKLHAPAVMSFTSSSPPPLNPRKLDKADVVVDESGSEDEEEEEDSIQPFPFTSSSKDLAVEKPDPIFDESGLHASQTSDNVRAVVSVGDMLGVSPGTAMVDETQKSVSAVQMLLDFPDSVCASEAATTLQKIMSTSSNSTTNQTDPLLPC